MTFPSGDDWKDVASMLAGGLFAFAVASLPSVRVFLFEFSTFWARMLH
jgi:hypothetical protein